jgi:hypothetical protein
MSVQDAASTAIDNSRPTARAGNAVRRMTRRAYLIAEILSTYVRVRYLLRNADVPEVVRILRNTGLKPASVPSSPKYWEGRRLANAVTRTLTPLPVDSRCLMRSLVLSRMLARRDIDSTLVIAVKSEPDFGAHAWVEHGQWPLLPPGDFERLVTL